MKRKSLVPLLIVACGVFLFAAIRLVQAYAAKDARQAIDAAAVAQVVETALPERTAGVLEKRADDAMPALAIDRLDVIGLLELPEQGVKLPVGDLQGDPSLTYRPARYAGTLYDGSLTITGVYDDHELSVMESLAGGETMVFTDMTGTFFTFSVERVRRVSEIDENVLTAFDADLIWFAQKGSTWFVVCCRAAG